MRISKSIRRDVVESDPSYKYLKSIKEKQDQKIKELEDFRTLLVREIQKNVPHMGSIRSISMPKRYKGMRKPESANLDFSDSHIGEETLGTDVCNLTDYNFSEFKVRLDELAKGGVECLDIQMTKIPIIAFNINFLGDIVTGEDIFLGQGRRIDLPLIEQCFEGANEIINRLIIPIRQMLPKECVMRIRGVGGNHGRGWGKPGTVSYKTNWDYVVYKIMAERLADQKNIEFYISETSMMLFTLPEADRWNHMIIHGDEVNSWMSIPYYGLDRTHSRMVQLFNMPVNYLHCGHFHSTFSGDVPYGEKLINGSFVGATEFTIRKMQVASQPKQKFYGFNNHYGITWMYNIKLAELKRLSADKNGIMTPYKKK